MNTRNMNRSIKKRNLSHVAKVDTVYKEDEGPLYSLYNCYVFLYTFLNTWVSKQNLRNLLNFRLSNIYSLYNGCQFDVNDLKGAGGVAISIK